MESLFSSKVQSWLLWFFRGLVVLGFIIIFARLVELQIIKGDYYRGLAEGNRIRRIPINAPRGKILARGGEVLVGNKKVTRRVVFNPQSGYEKSKDIKNTSQDELIVEWVREYNLGAIFAHISGYLGEVNKDELDKINPLCLKKGPRKMGQFVGRGGLEEEYECLLSGVDGEELIEVNSRGERIRTLGKKESQSGKDLKTSINYKLQKKVAEIIKDKKGSVVVTDAKGQVLALYSSPSFDPNLFVEGQKDKEINSLLNDENLPFFNRAIGGAFHPGSVFKPIVATAALEEGEVDKDFRYEDKGQITIETPYGDFAYSNWYFTQYGKTEGEIGITKAIARSTDTFFYKLGELLGVKKIVNWSLKFGLSRKTGIDLPGEVEGLVPTPEWKRQVKGEKWFLGNTYHMSIGQGDIALTPIQVNTAISAVASEGELCLPKIADKPVCKDMGVDKNSIKLVKEGMVGACSRGGTGYPFFEFKPQAACKTGTAETGDSEKTHAWFSVYAPADFPEIVVTVLVEEGGEGSKVAAPIAREIFDFWFGKK